MTKEAYIRALILQRSPNIKEFAASIQMPYTTLLGMLKNGLGGAAVDNVIRVCRALDLTIEELLRIEEAPQPPEPFSLSDRERALILQYRSRPAMQPAVDVLLGLRNEP